MLEYSKEKLAVCSNLPEAKSLRKNALLYRRTGYEYYSAPWEIPTDDAEHKAELESKAMQQTEQESQQKPRLIMKSARQMFIRTRRQRRG